MREAARDAARLVIHPGDAPADVAGSPAAAGSVAPAAADAAADQPSPAPVRALSLVHSVRLAEEHAAGRPEDAGWPAEHTAVRPADHAAVRPAEHVARQPAGGSASEEFVDIDLPLDAEPRPAIAIATAPPTAAERAAERVERAPDGAAREEPSWNRPSGVSPITRSERRAAEAAAADRAAGIEQVDAPRGQVLWALVRLALAAAFLWTFFDKLFGLGAPTPAANAWLAGGSPAAAHLAVVDGPLAGLFTTLAGQSWVDWVFMITLALTGVALLLGVGLVAAATAATLLAVAWAVALPEAGNPVLDQRLLAALVIVSIAASGAGLRYSLAPWWRRTRLVRKVWLLR